MKIDPTVWIETSKGRRFYFANPTFDSEEIAHSLANQCRYVGQSLRRYSTAEHSILVSMICEQMGLCDPFEGLMHDAHEAYMGDMSSPLKSLLKDYRFIEDHVEAQLREVLVLPSHKTSGCDFADKVALVVEARQMMPSKGENWKDVVTPAHRQMANRLTDLRVNFWDAPIVRSHFLATYAELAGPRGLLLAKVS